MFSERSADRAARLRTPLPALGALTACAHVQWDATSSDPAALFSLAVPTLANALQLRAFAEPGGAVHAALVVRGHHAPFRAAVRADGRWHHVCVTWEQLGGRWSLFADGRRRSGARGLGAGHPLPPDGILVLGQDQDSLGGGFSARDAFSGNLTDFHLWARALSPGQMHRARACAPPPGGLLFRWDLGALDVTPSLLPPVWVRLLCPGTACPASCCQAPPTFGSTHHLLASLPTSANRATPKSGHAFSRLPVPTWYLVTAAWRDSPRTPAPNPAAALLHPVLVAALLRFPRRLLTPGSRVLVPPQACKCLQGPNGLWVMESVGSQEAALTPLPPWPVPSEECPSWDPAPHTEGSLLCLQPLPFLCCYRTGAPSASVEGDAGYGSV